MNDNEANLANVVSQMANFSSVDVNSLGVPDFLAVLGISLLASFYIALLHNRFCQSRATAIQAHHAFPVLGLSVTSIFICIQFSLPLSLGLLGALSIVRFRTPIKEPEEVAFIMLVIASSICCATFNFIFLTVILGIAVVGMLVARWGDVRTDDPYTPNGTWRKRSERIVQHWFTDRGNKVRTYLEQKKSK